MKKLLFSSILLFILLNFSYSQCLLYQVSLSERIQNSQYVYEGKVISKTSYWNQTHTNILTSNVVEVYKVFKGNILGNQVEVITEGGIVGDQMEIVDPSLQLEIEDVGMFFTYSNIVSGKNSVLKLIPYASVQGFVKYSQLIGKAFDHFSQYDIIHELYPIISNSVNHSFDVKIPFNVQSYLSPIINKVGQTITSFSPANLSAGKKDILTINGTGFGANSGSAAVLFRKADDGGASLVVTNASDILSWSATQITCYVPSGAGTGAIRVRTSDGDQGSDSPSSLTVNYNITNLGAAGYPIAVLKNGASGYTYKYSNNTANGGVSFYDDASARTRFESALQSWRCNTGFNVNTSATSTVINTPTADDNYTVMYDNDASPLGAGVLGVGHSFYTSCGSDWRVRDIDIRFRRDGTGGTTWYFGADTGSQPGGSSDFESVALHELGHNHQIGHTINTSDAMNYSITTGTNKRNLNAQNLAAGQFVISNGTGKLGSCGESPMTAFNCSLAPVADFSSDVSGGCGTPLTVNFTDESLYAPTSWSWDFGDGGNSTSQNPSHIYALAGTYTVTLSATNANGSDSEIKTGFIVINNPPTAASCTPISDNNSAGVYGFGIENVTLNTINNTTLEPVDEGGYLDLTCSKTTTLVAGQTYSMSVDLGFGTNFEDARVYIDYNNDGSFNETDEKVKSLSGVNGVQTFDITIPVTATFDQLLRMRVIDEAKSSYGLGTLVNSCGGATGHLGEGQAEDYGLLITCTTPQVDNLPDVPANMSWTLPVLTNGNYYTGPGGTGSLLAAGTKITSSQTIYIYNTMGSCTNESSFDITILTILRGSECNKSHATLTNYIYANAITGATHYKFKVVTENMTTYYATSTSNKFRLFEAYSGLDYGSTYSVSVAYSKDGGTTYTAYGNACNVKVLNKLKNWYCGTTTAMNSFKASYPVTGATKYRYKLVEGVTTLIYDRNYADPTFRLSWVPGIQNNKTYTVSVATYDGSSWSDYGATCTVTTPASGMIQNDDDEDLAINTSLTVYPNPNNGSFTISASNEGSYVLINSLGQKVQDLSISKENGLETKVEGLKQGVYFVIGNFSNEVITRRIVVQ